ncbi:protein SUPPRESSOR OF MAX2 1-like [Aristolochia californica]|uniref:protein SUPPRESSOR OF MAX2 1-like n=1 Tax=Aristolochia californica TaxID=171875 RepID=UPI0035D8AA89
MRAGLSTIQQTLTPEAANVLNHSIAEAGRRNHGQTTPLHVAATLLSSPSGYLRQACIRSHPNSSHPLQCRALELCFSVALERLPSSQNLSPGLEPPISNALMAALKRAQAHQRRGCPEQQQPLLAVKVELEQLIISILDDPSVSRVMREASFSSPAVKATIEQSLNSANSVNSSPIGSANGLGLRPGPPPVNRNLYLNPRLQAGNSEQWGIQRKEEVKRVIDILLRTKKRNPVLVGESEPQAVLRELLQRIEKREISDGLLRNVQIVSLEKEFGSDKSQILRKLKDLVSLVQSRISSTGANGVLLDLGDLKWLVEQTSGFGVPGSAPLHQQQQPIVSETAQLAVEEMGKLLTRFGEGPVRVWLIGTATCETYLRCQVYHASMENDWDLQAVPIAARAPLPGLFPRLGSNGILSSSVESLTPLKGFPMVGGTLSNKRLSDNKEPARGANFCSSCSENYERELAKLVAKEFERSSSEAKPETLSPLPQWMKVAKHNNGGIMGIESPEGKDQELLWKQKTEELQKKWTESCRQLHPSFHSSLGCDRSAAGHPMMNAFSSNLLGRQASAPKLQITRNPPSLQLNHNLVRNPAAHPQSPPKSPVRTELVLGHPKVRESTLDKTHKERIKDLSDCIPSDWPLEKFSALQNMKHATTLDADSFKSLFKGLTERVPWQTDAASVVATTIIQCRSGAAKRRGTGAKGDAWMLFLGPDKVGMKKMALALSELVCRPGPVTIRLGIRGHDVDEEDVRGRTVLDRIAEAVRRNPLSVVVLEDIDQADMLVQSSIRWAIERGRLPDSYGREVGLGSVIFILTAGWLPENIKKSLNSVGARNEKLATMAPSSFQLQLSFAGKTNKRRAEWSADEERASKPRKESSTGEALSFDLNLAAETEEQVQEGSRNSSDLTVEYEHEQKWTLSRTSMPRELVESVDDTIVFRPVDFAPIRSKVASAIVAKFAAAVGEGHAVDVEEEALERIVGGVWFGRTGLEEWADRVLVPSFQQLKSSLPPTGDGSGAARVVKLSYLPTAPETRYPGEWLPAKITIDVDDS